MVVSPKETENEMVEVRTFGCPFFLRDCKP